MDVCLSISSYVWMFFHFLYTGLIFFTTYVIVAFRECMAIRFLTFLLMAKGGENYVT